MKSAVVQRNCSISILRLAAALMVLSGHMSYIMGMLPVIVWGQAIQGLGVKIFFLLGGALITKSWMLDQRPIRYMIKRFFRIWPPLAVNILATAFVFAPFLSACSTAEYFSSPVLWEYLKNLQLYIVYALPRVFEANPYPYAVNGSLWTLPVEVFMYIVIPIISVQFMRLNGRRRLLVTLGTVVTVCAVQIYHVLAAPEARFIVYATDWLSAMEVIPFYLIGMAYTLLGGEKYVNLPKATFLMLAFSCLNLQGIAYYVLFYPVFAYFILSLAFATEIHFVRVKEQNLEISYGVYLWGFFIQQSVVSLEMKYGLSLSFSANLVICTALSLCIGYLSHVLVEIPAQKTCKYVLKKIKV